MFRSFSFTILAVLLLTAPFIGFAASTSQFQYQRDIVGSTSYTGPAWLELDEQVFEHSTYADLRIFASNGTEVAYKLFNNNQEQFAPQAHVLAASSVRSDYRGQSFVPANILDGDSTTWYEADWQKDQGTSWVVIDLQKIELVNQIQLTTPQASERWDEIQIEVSDDNITYHSALARTESNAQIYNIPDSQSRYIKITFWYQGALTISEIELFGSGSSRMLFFHDGNEAYTLRYGALGISTPQYDTASLYSDISTPLYSLGAEIVNSEYSADADGDTILNNEDNCPFTANQDQVDSDNDQIGDLCDNAPFTQNAQQQDADFDGIGDSQDNCPYIKNSDQRDEDFDGIGWVCDDADNDGIQNGTDNCPTIANYSQADINNNGIGDACEEDFDGDGIAQVIDNCRNVNNPNQADEDGDGIGDMCDNCPQLRNSDQRDVNENNIGDICEDEDQDGIADSIDNCSPLRACGENSVFVNCISVNEFSNPDQADEDGDGIGDMCDNCPQLRNSDQKDQDKDGVGDVCGDQDNDGIFGYQDNCPTLANPDQADQDNDGIGNACEDDDKDGILNATDNCPYDYNPNQADLDSDGAGNICDDSDDRWTENNAWLLWLAIVAAVGVMGYLAIRLIKKTKEPQEPEEL